MLDLAIRGKLVPQDPNDEPASVLLERIRAQKQQMVKDGKLKAKDIKNDTVIFVGDDNLHYEKFADGTVKCIEDEIPFDLPEGWAWERLSNIASFSGGKTPSTSVESFWGKDVLWVTSKDMKTKYIDSSLMRLSNLGAEQLQIYPIGTLLLVVRSGILRHTLPVSILKAPATVNQDLKAISLYYSNIEEYIYICFKGMENEILHTYTKAGATVENVNFDAFQKMLLPFPPEEQIPLIISNVQDADHLIGIMDENTGSIKEDITQAKSKILDLAIRGKLVPQDPTDEPASVLLDRTRTEKEELIKQGKIKRDKKESVIFKGEDNSYYLSTSGQVESIEEWNLGMIPESWTFCCLGEVCDYGNCINVETDAINDTDWILDLEDIEKDSGRVLKKVIKRDRNANSTKHRFHKGQVLYSKLRPYLNKVVLADDDGYCTSEILPLEFNEVIVPEYARYYLMSPTFLAYADRCSYGVKMPRLGTPDGKKAVFAVPPVGEQKRIVEAIESAFEQLDNIASTLE